MRRIYLKNNDNDTAVY